MRSDSHGTDLSVLAARAGSGDANAFSALVQQSQRTAYRLALRMVGSESDAADVVQEAAFAGRSSLIERWLPVAWPAAAIATLAASALLVLALQRHVATARTPAVHDDPIAAATGTTPIPDISIAVLALESR